MVEATMKKPVYELFKDKSGEWRWRLIAPNGEIVAVSEGYRNKQAARDTINAIRQYALDAIVKEV